MPKISTYPIKETPIDSDKLLGTEVGGDVKNFQISKIKEIVLDDIENQISEELELDVATVTENTNLDPDIHEVVVVDATTGNKTMYLPVVANSYGVKFVIKKIDDSANTVTVAASGSELIDNEPTKVVAFQYKTISVTCDGIEWYIVQESAATNEAGASAILEYEGTAIIGGDKTIVEERGEHSLDIQGERDSADLTHLFWSGDISSFEDAGGGSVIAHYTGDGGVELMDGDSVVIADSTNYNGTYTIFNVVTDVEDSFEFTATWVSTETATWTNQRLYDKLRPNENANDNSWSLEAQTEFYAEAPNSVTIGARNKALLGWGGDWSGAYWGTVIGYQNILGGKGGAILGNNNIVENYWSTCVGDHNHLSQWSQKSFGSWNILQGGDCLGVGSRNDTYGWKNITIGNNNYVSGNENHSYGDGNIIHDSYGVSLNETPDPIHNRFNIAIGHDNVIGSTSDLGSRSDGSITAFADEGDGNHVTVTSVAHGLVEGDVVEITGTTSYNGKFKLAHVTTDTFSIISTWVADDATGTWTQNYTVNNAVLIGVNNVTEADGAVVIGKNITNTFDNSIEIGSEDTAKIAIRSNGMFIFPEGGVAVPTTDTLPDGHWTMWEDATKVRIYKNDGGVIKSVDIGGSFS